MQNDVVGSSEEITRNTTQGENACWVGARTRDELDCNSLTHPTPLPPLTPPLSQQKEWSTISSEWSRRFSGELNDITPPSSLSNSYTSTSGKKLFFLCDSAKVPVSDIENKKFKLRKRVEKSTLKTTSGLNKSTTSSILPRMSVIHKEDSQTLLSRSFMKPTLKGDSFGPGDSHKRAMENYYHVQDSLPPEPLTGRQVSILCIFK